MEIVDEFKIEMTDQLNQFLPDGIKILDVKEISKNTNKLTASINLMDYEVSISDSEIDTHQITEFLNNEEIIVERNRKGVIKKIDIRPFIDSIENDKKRLQIRTRSINGNTARINEILATLFNKHSDQNKSIHRKNQYVQDNSSIQTPMENL